jgi:hypothetical protein
LHYGCGYGSTTSTGAISAQGTADQRNLEASDRATISAGTVIHEDAMEDGVIPVFYNRNGTPGATCLILGERGVHNRAGAISIHGNGASGKASLILMEGTVFQF